MDADYTLNVHKISHTVREIARNRKPVNLNIFVSTIPPHIAELNCADTPPAINSICI